MSETYQKWSKWVVCNSTFSGFPWTSGVHSLVFLIWSGLWWHYLRRWPCFFRPSWNTVYTWMLWRILELFPVENVMIKTKGMSPLLLPKWTEHDNKICAPTTCHQYRTVIEAGEVLFLFELIRQIPKSQDDEESFSDALVDNFRRTLEGQVGPALDLPTKYGRNIKGQRHKRPSEKLDIRIWHSHSS